MVTFCASIENDFCASIENDTCLLFCFLNSKNDGLLLVLLPTSFLSKQSFCRNIPCHRLAHTPHIWEQQPTRVRIADHAIDHERALVLRCVLADVRWWERVTQPLRAPVRFDVLLDVRVELRVRAPVVHTNRVVLGVAGQRRSAWA